MASLYRLLADAELLPRLKLPALERLPEERKAAHHRRVENAEREARDRALKELDEELWQQIKGHNLAETGDTKAYLPFVLRSHALDRQLSPFELGRALYHLAQHRGFAVSRAAASAEDQEALAALEDAAQPEVDDAKGRKAKPKGGKFAEALVRYTSRCEQPDAKGRPQRTIGEIQYRMIQNHETTTNGARAVTVRRQGEPAWRSMYEDEFAAIWLAQAAFNPALDAKVTLERFRRSRRGGGDPHVVLSREVPLREAVERTIFHQRPLKSAAHLIGECDLENGLNCYQENGQRTRSAPRLPWAHPLAQRFRMVQLVNNAAILNPDGSLEPLTSDHRKGLFELLERSPRRVTFAAARVHLRLPRWAKFNFERSDSASEKSFEVVATEHLFLSALGDRWDSMPDEEREELFHDWYSIQNPEALKFRLAVYWGLGVSSGSRSSLRGSELTKTLAARRSEAKAQDRNYGFRQARAEFGDLVYSERVVQLARATPAPGYCNLSSRAIRKLLPLMLGEGGPLTYGEARDQIYARSSTPPVDRLAPLNTVIPELTSPVVRRTLSEMRKVINALIIEEGYKPDRIHIEVARDLRTDKQGRKDIVDRQKLDRAANDSAAQIATEMGILDRNGRPMVTKVKLAQECGWCCPYTGEPFGAEELRTGEVEIEHIIPQSMIPGDSFDNLTLAYREANAVKGDKPPHAAFNGNPAGYNWIAILERVSRFKGKDEYAKLKQQTSCTAGSKSSGKSKDGAKRAHPKLRLFKLEGTREQPSDALKKHCEGFTHADLAQTAWMTRAACGYLATLYGVPVDAPHLRDEDGNGKRRVYAVAGAATGFLRRNLGTYIKGADSEAPEDKYWRDLNTILWPTQDIAIPGRTRDGKKSRADHRHHAIDAIVVAMATPSLVNRISQAAGSNSAKRRRYLRVSVRRAAAAAWPTIYDDIKAAMYGGIDSQGVEWPELVVSERLSRRLQGELHNATLLKKGKDKLLVGKGPRERSVRNRSNPLMLVARKKGRLVGRVVALLEALDCARRGEKLSSLLHPDEEFQYILWARIPLELTNNAVRFDGRDGGCIYYINGFEADGTRINAAPHWWGANADRNHPASVRSAISVVAETMHLRRVLVSVTGRWDYIEARQ